MTKANTAADRILLNHTHQMLEAARSHINSDQPITALLSAVLTEGDDGRTISMVSANINPENLTAVANNLVTTALMMLQYQNPSVRDDRHVRRLQCAKQILDCQTG